MSATDEPNMWSNLNQPTGFEESQPPLDREPHQSATEVAPQTGERPVRIPPGRNRPFFYLGILLIASIVSLGLLLSGDFAGGVIIFIGAGIVFSIIAVEAYYAYLGDLHRSDLLSDVAADLNFQFSRLDNEAFVQDLSAFQLCQQGNSRTVVNLMRGQTKNLEVALCEYHYSTGHNRKNRKTYFHLLIWLRCPGQHWDHFSLRPSHFFDQIGSWVGFQDINFDSHPEFSRHYTLRGENEAGIRKLFTPEVLNYFEQQADCNLEVVADQFLYHIPNQQLSPDSVRQHLEKAFELLALFKQEEAVVTEESANET